MSRIRPSGPLRSSPTGAVECPLTANLGAVLHAAESPYRVLGGPARLLKALLRAPLQGLASLVACMSQALSICKEVWKNCLDAWEGALTCTSQQASSPTCSRAFGRAVDKLPKFPSALSRDPATRCAAPDLTVHRLYNVPLRIPGLCFRGQVSYRLGLVNTSSPLQALKCLNRCHSSRHVGPQTWPQKRLQPISRLDVRICHP